MANFFQAAPQITHRQLHKVLTGLGFVRRETAQFTVYREQEHDALIVLPNREANSNVDDPHFIAVRNTVVGRGVTSLENLNSIFAGIDVQTVTSRPRLRSFHSRRVSTKAPVKPHSPRFKSKIKKHFTPASQG